MCSRSVLRMSIILHRLQLRLSHSLFLQIDYFIKYPHFRYHGSTSRTNLTIDPLCTGIEQKNSPVNHLQVMRSPAEHRQPFDEINNRHTLNEVGDVAEGRLRKGEVESACKPVINLQLAKPLIGLFHLVVKG